MDPNYETRLRRRLAILKDYFEQGKIRIADHLTKDLHQSLAAVRTGPDGEIDLSTVDSRVRAMALAIAAIKDRENAKSVMSLREVQEAYFGFIQANFGDFYKVMLEVKASPHQAASFLSRKDDVVREFSGHADEFLGQIREFWDALEETARVHVEDQLTLKAVFGGDLFPESGSNIASRCGIYTDTIILPDPFLRTEIVFKGGSVQKKTFYLLKRGLNLLKYRELALADIEPLIVAILPDLSSIDESEQELLTQLARRDGLIHAARVFGRPFVSDDELREFVASFDSVPKAIGAVADKTRLLFDAEWIDPLEQQLARYMQDLLTQFVGASHAGHAIAANCAGRMGQANDILLKSRRLRGSPLIDAPTSWRYLTWKMQYDAESFDPENATALHVIRGLQDAAEGEMVWIGNIPAEALIEIRRQGAIGELREMLSRDIPEIVAADAKDFTRTADKIASNIRTAFDDHNARLKKLSDKKLRFAGIDVGACLVRGTVELASAFGIPGVSLINTAIDQLTNVPKWKELPGRFRKLRSESDRLEGSPVGLLFRISKT